MNNVRNHYGLPCVVSVNHFTADTERGARAAREDDGGAERAAGARAALGRRRRRRGRRGAQGRGARSSADKSNFSFVYDEKQTLWDKIKTIATKIYGAADISADAKIRAQIDKLQKDGYGHYPVCIAKTQYSFSTDPACARRAERPHRSTSARCASRPAPSSSWWSAATS